MIEICNLFDAMQNLRCRERSGGIDPVNAYQKTFARRVYDICSAEALRHRKRIFASALKRVLRVGPKVQSTKQCLNSSIRI